MFVKLEYSLYLFIKQQIVYFGASKTIVLQRFPYMIPELLKQAND